MVKLQDLSEKLTRRELQVFYLILANYKTSEIIKELNISLNTVRTYYKHIYQKMFVNSKKELIKKFKKEV